MFNKSTHFLFGSTLAQYEAQQATQEPYYNHLNLLKTTAAVVMQVGNETLPFSNYAAAYNYICDNELSTVYIYEGENLLAHF